MPVEIIRNEYMIVKVSGSIDIYNVQKFRAALDKAMEDPSNGLIIDLSEAVYIDSSGIQTIFYVYKQVRSTGRKMALVLGTRNIRELFAVVGLDALPGIFIGDDLTSAEQALGEE